MSTSRVTYPVPARDGIELTLHHWRAADERAAVAYVHGLQSHAGWLSETGPEIAARGVSVFALDRRGSGSSGGPRGDLPTAGLVLNDYRRGVATIRAHTDAPLTGAGQSFGGSVLAALVADQAPLFDGVAFIAPALGQQRARLREAALAERRAEDSIDERAVPLEDRDYTDDPERLAYMAEDPLMVRRVPARTFATMVALEDRYIAAPRWSVPRIVHLAVPRTDPIIDLAAAASVLAARVPVVRSSTFGTDHHYLEFTGARRAYWDWLADTALTATIRASA